MFEEYFPCEINDTYRLLIYPRFSRYRHPVIMRRNILSEKEWYHRDHKISHYFNHYNPESIAFGNTFKAK